MLLSLLFACATTADYAADELWTALDGYDGWDQAAEWTGVKASCGGAHGPYVQIWYNDVAAPTVEAGTGTFPDGSVLVKETYDEDAVSLRNITAMQKVDGFDPDNGDWYWGVYQEDGTSSSSGSVSGCFGCHASGSDHVLFVQSDGADTPEACP